LVLGQTFSLHRDGQADLHGTALVCLSQDRLNLQSHYLNSDRTSVASHQTLVSILDYGNLTFEHLYELFLLSVFGDEPFHLFAHQHILFFELVDEKQGFLQLDLDTLHFAKTHVLLELLKSLQIGNIHLRFFNSTWSHGLFCNGLETLYEVDVALRLS
jgi:hypothetical protein